MEPISWKLKLIMKVMWWIKCSCWFGWPIKNNNLNTFNLLINLVKKNMRKYIDYAYIFYILFYLHFLLFKILSDGKLKITLLLKNGISLWGKTQWFHVLQLHSVNSSLTCWTKAMDWSWKHEACSQHGRIQIKTHPKPKKPNKIHPTTAYYKKLKYFHQHKNKNTSNNSSLMSRWHHIVWLNSSQAVINSSDIIITPRKQQQQAAQEPVQVSFLSSWRQHYRHRPPADVDSS